jgi:hypothetical protein
MARCTDMLIERFGGRFILAPINQRNRSIDIDVLWPILRDRAESLDMAKNAFRLHVSVDSAWRHVSPVEIDTIMGKLK